MASPTVINKYSALIFSEPPRDNNGCVRYTRLPTSKRIVKNGWVCPACKADPREYPAQCLYAVGYISMPREIEDYVVMDIFGSNPYIYKWFVNPSGAKKCLNAMNAGFSGTQCTFDREEAEGFPDVEWDMPDAIRTPHKWMGKCFRCSFPKEVVEKDQGLAQFIKDNGTELAIGEHPEPPYMEVPGKNCWWFGVDSWARCLKYNGTVESTHCRSKQYGAGLQKERAEDGVVVVADSKDVTCTGRYGGPRRIWNFFTDDADMRGCCEIDWKPEHSHEADRDPPEDETLTVTEMHEAYASDFDDEDDEDDEDENSAGEVFYLSASSSS